MNPSSPARRGWRRPYTLAALLVAAGLSVPFCLRRDSEWEQVYVAAAARLGSGQDLYPPGTDYLYPPFSAWAALPFAPLPPPAGRGLWLLLNLACLAVMARAAWRLAGGGPLEGDPPAPAREHVAWCLGLAGAAPYLLNCLAHQQTDLVIGALLLGGCLLLGRSRALPAATCFGLAAAMKCTALLWAPYLAWRRRWAAAAWLAAVALGANLLPDLLSPPPSGEP